MQAIYLELFGIAILKSTNYSIAMEAHIAKDEYLESKNYSYIASLYNLYNRAFGSSMIDGIKEMVSVLSESLTGSRQNKEIMDTYYD